MPKNNFKEVIKNLNSHNEWPALNLVKNDPVIPAVISKLIKSKDQGPKLDIRNGKSFNDINSTNFKNITESIASRISDVRYIKDLFPDIELAEQILISSILSPKDMMSSNIIYKLKETIMSPEVTTRVIDEISEYMEKTYKISETLPEILLETLFETGAYVKAIIPESSVDELINYNSSNITTESLVDKNLFNPNMGIKNVGFLGTPYDDKKVRFGIESISYKGNYDPYIKIDKESYLPNQYRELVEVIDNVDILKLPKIISHNSRQAIRNKFNTLNKSLENFFDNEPDPDKGYTNSDITDMMFKDNGSMSEPFIYVPNKAQTKRKSIGKPLLLKLPTESVIPVHVPGNPSEHIGYFIMIDEEGNPLTEQDNSEYLEGLNNVSATNNSLSSFLIQKSKRNLVGNDRVRTDNVEQQAKIYANIIEADLIERLKRGIYNRKLALGKVEEIYRIMLARSLANKQTKLLFMPAEIITYFANDYLPNGVGKSLMDNMKILTSLRAILLFAKVMAMTKAAISRTIVNVDLDPDDPDPQKTMEEIVHESLKSRQQYFPLGINSPVDITEWIQRAGYEFRFSNHPGLPETKLDYEASNFEQQVPDSELDELLRKWTFMAMGLSPEMVDNGFDTEFATTAVINNLLLSKRVLQIQKRFTLQLSDFLRKILMNDSYIQNTVLTIFKENKNSLLKYSPDEEKELYKEDPKQFFIKYYYLFIENFYSELPRPDASALEVQAHEFELYSENIEKCIEAYVNTEFITSDTQGNISNYIDEIKSAYKNYFLRDWMAKNNFLPELADITSADEDGKPKLDLYTIYKEHNTALIRSAIAFIQNMAPIKRAADKDIEKAEEEPQEDDSSSSPEIGSYGSTEDNTEESTDENKEDEGEGGGDEGGSDDGLGDLGLDFNF